MKGRCSHNSPQHKKHNPVLGYTNNDAKKTANVLMKKSCFNFLNEDVDLDSNVQVITIEQLFSGENPKVLRKRFPKKIRNKVLSVFKEGVINADTNMKIGMSGRDFKEHLHFNHQGNDSDEFGIVHLEAIMALSQLIQSASLIRSYDDKKPKVGSSIKKMHHYVSALRTNNKDYSVVLTVKEFKDDSLNLYKENPVRLYHHRVVKSLSSVTSTAMPIEQVELQTTPERDSYTLHELLVDVKDSDGNFYLEQVILNF